MLGSPLEVLPDKLGLVGGFSGRGFHYYRSRRFRFDRNFRVFPYYGRLGSDNFRHRGRSRSGDNDFHDRSWIFNYRRGSRNHLFPELALPQDVNLFRFVCSIFPSNKRTEGFVVARVPYMAVTKELDFHLILLNPHERKEPSLHTGGGPYLYYAVVLSPPAAAAVGAPTLLNNCVPLAVTFTEAQSCRMILSVDPVTMCRAAGTAVDRA